MIDFSNFEQKEIEQIFIGSMQEIMGDDDLQSLLHQAGLGTNGIAKSLNAAGFTEGWQALVDTYGRRGAEGVILRSGQVFFKDFLRKHGFETGLMENEFRSLPKPRRIRRGLGVLADLQEEMIPGTDITISEEDEYWLWQTCQCGWCKKREDNRDALSKFTIGVIQEFLFWTSGGKCYPVQEANDEESGHPLFVIRIDKEYIE
jgi:hypothetical protein